MSTPTYQDYRAKAIRENEEYKAFVIERLCAAGFDPSKMDIKLDRRFADTGNLAIEAAEKARPRDGNYAKSGIYRANTPVLAIGNYQMLFIFEKSALVECYEKQGFGVYPVRMYVTETSKGFVLSSELAKKIATRVIDFTEGPSESGDDFVQGRLF